MRPIGIALMLVLVSCGGGSSSAPGTATFSGSVRGQSMVPRDAIASVVSFNGNGVPGRAAVIGITSAAGLCPLLSAGKEPKSTQYLVLTAFQMQPDYSAAPPPKPGNYPVGALSIENAVVVFAGTDASCHSISQGEAVASSGSITFTAVGDRYAGSYDLTFDFGDRVTGTFDAPGCNGLSQLAPATGTLECQP